MGVDIQLIPTYTPIRTDEHDVSVDRVFFGGVNVYLQQKSAIFRHLPMFLDRVLDQPRLLRWVTSRGIEVDPRELGALTVSMLRGVHGAQRKEMRRLSRWLVSGVRPDLIVLTNILIGGCIPEIKRQLDVPILVTLQGDDSFLDELPEPYRQRAFDEIGRLVDHIDGFLVHSRYYSEYMTGYFGLSPERLHRVALGIDTREFEHLVDTERRPPNSAPRRIGYLARLTRQKGLHVLIDAFLTLRQFPDCGDVELHIAGWLGEDHRAYADAEFEKLKAAGLEQAFRYAGAVDRAGKVDFLRGLDVFSVPTTYRDPKGLFALEAMAAGVPVVLPNHGAFPEVVQRTGGGCLAEPEDPQSLAEQLHRLLSDSAFRTQLGTAGQAAVHQHFNASRMAEETMRVFRSVVDG
jgi:glycosyltransferase involved in cell wall biosynthesis